MAAADVKYTQDHEWIALTGAEAEVGITDYAQRQLGDVVFVELPDVGRTLGRGEPFGSIESVKAVSELFTPMSGEVIAVNTSLSEEPEQVNADATGTWLIKLKLSDPSEAADLMTADDYDKFIK